MVLVIVLLFSSSKLFVGKHRIGKYMNQWGTSSTESGTERPIRTACRLIEHATLGLLGSRKELEHKVKKVGITALHYHVYSLETDLFPIESVMKYIESCFVREVTELICPPGLLPWTKTKWIDINKDIKVDEFCHMAIQYYLSLKKD